MVYELISKVLINVLFISAFISIFFFTYGTIIEKNVIINQMKVISNNVMQYVELSGNKINTELYKYNNKLLLPKNMKKISENDEKALSGNKEIIELVQRCIGIFSLVVLIIIILFFFISKVTNKDGDEENKFTFSKILEILIESLIILIFIGLTEFSFLIFFGANYISIDTNEIKLDIVKFLKKYKESLIQQFTLYV
jgi:hypothetical protein